MRGWVLLSQKMDALGLVPLVYEGVNKDHETDYGSLTVFYKSESLYLCAVIPQGSRIGLLVYSNDKLLCSAQCLHAKVVDDLRGLC